MINKLVGMFILASNMALTIDLDQKSQHWKDDQTKGQSMLNQQSKFTGIESEIILGLNKNIGDASSFIKQTNNELTNLIIEFPFLIVVFSFSLIGFFLAIIHVSF